MKRRWRGWGWGLRWVRVGGVRREHGVGEVGGAALQAVWLLRGAAESDYTVILGFLKQSRQEQEAPASQPDRHQS